VPRFPFIGIHAWRHNQKEENSQTKQINARFAKRQELPLGKTKVGKIPERYDFSAAETGSQSQEKSAAAIFFYVHTSEQSGQHRSRIRIGLLFLDRRSLACYLLPDTVGLYPGVRIAPFQNHRLPNF
jgi:hypothetical protein